jgi:hypothetical protein
LSAAQSSAKGAVVKGTDDKQVRAWNHFQTYLHSIGLHSDPYLDDFSRDQKIKILSAFAWTAWLRPSSWLTEQIQGWTEIINLPSLYKGNYKDTPQQTTLPLHSQQ